MKSYELDINEKIKKNEPLKGNLNLSMLNYFWQASPIYGQRTSSIPRFLRSIDAFKNLSDYELFLLSRHIHMRSFAPGERIFKQGDIGVGFYIIFQGDVEIVAADLASELESEAQKGIGDKIETQIALLEKYEYFGELALLQENATRNASAIAKTSTVLLGIFKPDIEYLIDETPKVAAKLLQSVSIIISNRLSQTTKDIKILRYKLDQLEGKNE